MAAATQTDLHVARKPVLGQNVDRRLFLAFELGRKHWKLGFTTGFGQKARERSVLGGDLERVGQEIAAAKKRFRLGEDAAVRSCHEAGREGFFLHRFLLQIGVDNTVVDSSSIEVKRRARRAKTDRLDVHKLLTMLLRYDGDEKKVWSVERTSGTFMHKSNQTRRSPVLLLRTSCLRKGHWGRN